MTKCLDYLLIGTVALFLSACSQEPATTQSPDPDTEKLVAISTPRAETAATVDPKADNFDIRLLPERPQSGDCLKAIVTGKKGPLVFQWRVNSEELPERDGNSLCDAGLKRADIIEVRLVGSENGAELAIGNSPPRILEVSAGVEAAQQRKDITIGAVANDVDGDEVELRYQWFVNNEEDLFATTETLAADRYRKGDRIQVKITPFDGIDDGEPYLSAVLTIPNAPPSISSKPPEAFEALEYLYPVQAVDPDGDKLSYRLEEAPEGMSIDQMGKVSWNLAGIKPGEYPVKITVEDTDGGKITQSFAINLGAPKE